MVPGDGWSVVAAPEGFDGARATAVLGGEVVDPLVDVKEGGWEGDVGVPLWTGGLGDSVVMGVTGAPGSDVLGTDTLTAGVETLTAGVDTVTPGVDTPTSGTDTPTLGTDTPTLGGDTPTLGTDTPTLGTDTPTLGTDTPTLGRDTPMLGTATAVVGERA